MIPSIRVCLRSVADTLGSRSFGRLGRLDLRLSFALDPDHDLEVSPGTLERYVALDTGTQDDDIHRPTIWRSGDEPA
jgi:hypothetical protein